jgi:hypothetical protein
MKHRHSHKRSGAHAGNAFRSVELLQPVTRQGVEAFATFMIGLKRRNALPEDKAAAIRRQAAAFGQRGFDSAQTEALFRAIVAKHTPKAVPERKPATETAPHRAHAPAGFDSDLRGGIIHTFVSLAVAGAILAAGLFTLKRINETIEKQLKENREMSARIEKNPAKTEVTTFIRALPEPVHFITSIPPDEARQIRAKAQKPAEQPVFEIRPLRE